MANPFYDIRELTENFSKLNDEQVKQFDTRIVCKLLLAIAQQLSVISGKLGDIEQKLIERDKAKMAAKK